MIKQIFSLLLLFISLLNLNAQSFWKKADEKRISLRVDDERTIVPEKYQVFALDKVAFTLYLKEAPIEFTQSKGLALEMPMADGSLELFEVFESPLMQEGIAARYPAIKSYKAYSKVHKQNNMRFSV